MTPHSASKPNRSTLNNKQTPTNKKFKKRHWFLGSLLVLSGSWITHTTTANIGNSDAELQSQHTFEQHSQVRSSKLHQALSLSHEDCEHTQSALLNTLGQHAHSSALSLAPVQPTQAITPKGEVINYTVKSGDSLGGIFKKLGFNLSLPYKISRHEAAKKLVNISVGKKLSFELDHNKQLHSITYPRNTLQDFVVEFDKNQVVSAHTVDHPYETEQHIASGEVHSSLYEAALEAGVSNRITMEMVRIFGWDIDFALDIRSGDHFHVIYDRHTANGETLRDGKIIAAQFTTQGETFTAIRHEDKNGESSYYTPEGKSMLGTFLRSPVEFSRISSHFGKRKHPILKKWRAHNGVDYAASRGTPIRSTADGKVSFLGRKGGYGRTVVINHAGRFSTLYAHMNGYAKGVRSGSRVKQGQVIGYIGSSGLATGPHLHYEFRVNGVHRNPLTYKTPKAKSINGESKLEFFIAANALEKQFNSINERYFVAKNSDKKDNNSANL